MDKILLIGRLDSSNPYALREVLSVQSHGDETITVVVVNVPHHSLIYPALLQMEERISSGEFTSDAVSTNFVRHLINMLDNNVKYDPPQELIAFVAKQLSYPWLRPYFCIYTDAMEGE